MTPRILIIDDNVALTTLLSKALSRFGYETVVENYSTMALTTAHRQQPDLILLDVMMPEKDGGRVLLELRNNSALRHIPVILLTAIAHEAQGLASLGGIHSPVMSKPVQLQELVQVVEQQLAASRSFMQDQEHIANRAQIDQLMTGWEGIPPNSQPMRNVSPQERGEVPGMGAAAVPGAPSSPFACYGDDGREREEKRGFWDVIRQDGQGTPLSPDNSPVDYIPPAENAPAPHPPLEQPERIGTFCFPPPKHKVPRNPW